MNMEQLTLTAEFMGIELNKVQACNEVITTGCTKYAAEKKYGVPPNTLGRHIAKFEKVLTYLLALAAEEDNKQAQA